MAYFRKMVYIDGDDEYYTIRLVGFNYANEKTFRLPPMPELMKFEIVLQTVEDAENPIDPNQTYTIHFILEDCPNLRSGPCIDNDFANVKIHIVNMTQQANNTSI